jgi:hypothetical protein
MKGHTQSEKQVGIFCNSLTSLHMGYNMSNPLQQEVMIPALVPQVKQLTFTKRRILPVLYA